MKYSRTYKLRLSHDGIELFLQCHYRVAHLLREFVPYGRTLSVAVAILDRQEPCDVMAELAGARCRACMGVHIRYVGSSMNTARFVAQIGERLIAHNELAAPPKAIQMYVTALLCLSSAENHEIVEAYQRISAADQPNGAG
jgi:hypothetical protein